MGAIDDGENTVLPRPQADFLNGYHKRGGRGDMAEVNNLCTRVHPLPELVDHFFRRVDRDWDGMLFVMVW